MEALSAPDATACFVRGFLHIPASVTSALGNPALDLTPTRGLPWVPATAAASLAAAALRIMAVPLPLGALAVALLSTPECLPFLLSHFNAARTSDGSNDA